MAGIPAPDQGHPTFLATVGSQSFLILPRKSRRHTLINLAEFPFPPKVLLGEWAQLCGPRGYRVHCIMTLLGLVRHQFRSSSLAFRVLLPHERGLKSNYLKRIQKRPGLRSLVTRSSERGYGVQNSALEHSTLIIVRSPYGDGLPTYRPTTYSTWQRYSR